jgi:hypothetical protein
VKQYMTFQKLPMLLVFGLIVWAWLSFVSVLIGSLF